MTEHFIQLKSKSLIIHIIEWFKLVAGLSSNSMEELRLL